MSELEKAQLLEIADKLIGTLGDMPANQADEQVADQVKLIYGLLGYEIKTFTFKNKAHVALRLCTE
jgi:hypothetical protein